MPVNSYFRVFVRMSTGFYQMYPGLHINDDFLCDKCQEIATQICLSKK